MKSTRKYLFPNVIELNLQAGRPLGVNVYLIDGGSEYILLDIGVLDTLDELIDMIRGMDFPLSKCKAVIATHADVEGFWQAAGFRPSTPLAVGIERFAGWYREYFGEGIHEHGDSGPDFENAHRARVFHAS